MIFLGGSASLFNINSNMAELEFTPDVPWIGVNYNNGFTGYDENGIIMRGTKNNPGKKVLLLNLSLFCIESLECSSDIFIKEYVSDTSGETFALTLRNFQRAFSGGYYSLKGAKIFWDHVACYSYFGVVSDPLYRIQNSHKNSQYYLEYAKILEKYSPDIVIVNGVHLTNHILQDLDIVKIDYIKSPIFPNLQLSKFEVNGIMHIGTYHTASHTLSIGDLNEMYQLLFKI